MTRSGPTKGTNTQRGARAAQASREGKQNAAHKPTGQQGQDERQASAVRISNYHNASQNRS